MNYYDYQQAVKLNISYYRKKHGFTQEKLAEKINISRKHLSNIEAANTNTSINLEILFDISNALNIDIIKLLEIR